jgi:hypothetical protein
MDSPQNHIWGPHLWMILHSAAERIGLPQLRRLPQEEARIWINLLGSLRYSLPCPHCKQHYTAYYLANPIKVFNRDIIRQWLYNLHCQVNSRNGKPNEITLESIAEIYSKPFHFTRHFGLVSQQMGQALKIGWSSRDDIQRSVRAFNELKRFYDFF